MHYSHDEKELLIRCWEDRKHGAHGYSLRHSGYWLTIEPVENEKYDILITALTLDIDDLGYPIGEILKTDIIDSLKIAKFKKEVTKA